MDNIKELKSNSNFINLFNNFYPDLNINSLDKEVLNDMIHNIANIDISGLINNNGLNNSPKNNTTV
jgi:hypothetical protein